MRKLLKILFVTFVLLSIPVMSHAACNIVIDGEQLTCIDANGTVVEPFIHEGTTYVPVRAIAQAFDITITWDQETKTVHLGTVGGSPQLNEYINIFADGKEFFCLDANSVTVYPILQNGTTYLPIRGIGQLLGKTIVWDDVSKTATVLTPASEEALSYFKNAVSNTAAVPSLSAYVAFDGSISHNGITISSISDHATESYSPTGFTISSYLPLDYASGTAYLGNGKFFLTVSSSKFVSDPHLQQTLYTRNSPTTFSNLYIYIDTKSGYITNASVYFSGDLTYKQLAFNELFTVRATLQYPNEFSFPLIPFPDLPRADGEESVSAETGKNADSTLISSLVDSYVSAIVSANSKSLVSLLHSDDYKKLYGNKSASQLATELSIITKNLSSEYSLADGSYNLESLVYIDASTISASAEKAARAVISINLSDGGVPFSSEAVIFLLKKDGSWYLDPSMITALK